MFHLNSSAGPTSSVALPSASEPPQSDDTKSEVHSLLASTGNKPSYSRVLLATALIAICDSVGRSVKLRALLDQGSEMTFISERMAQCLKLKRVCCPISVSAVGAIHASTFN